MILYQCSNGAYEKNKNCTLQLKLITETKVMLVHDEHVVEEQPACGETLCSVEDFRAKYQHILDFDWDSECPV